MLGLFIAFTNFVRQNSFVKLGPGLSTDLRSVIYFGHVWVGGVGVVFPLIWVIVLLWECGGEGGGRKDVGEGGYTRSQ